MRFKPDANLVNYDVYPKVFRCGKKTEEIAYGSKI